MTNLETEPAALPPPSPPTAPPPAPRRWSRSDDRVVFGVAGGLGRALAVDPLLVRIAFVVLALFSGVGVVLYLAALALLADSPAAGRPSSIRRVGGTIAAVLCAVWVFSGDASLPEHLEWVVAFGLFGAAVALWRGRSPAEPTAPAMADASPAVDGDSTTDRWNRWTTQRRQRPRHPRSVLGLLTIGASAVIGAIVWLLNDHATNRGTLAFGWATVTLGAGLLVGSVAGRARWLVLPAITTATAAVVAAAVSFAGVAISGPRGDRGEVIDPGRTVAASYRTGIGSFDLWLTGITDDVTTSVDVGIGDLTVVVPDDADVHIDARAGAGSIDALGASRSGYRRALSVDSSGSGHSVNLTLRVGVGAIDVRRASFFDGPLLNLPTASPRVGRPPVRSFADGTVLFADGSIDFGDGWRIEADGSFQIPIIEQRLDGSVQLDNGAVIRADGSVVSPGGFLITGAASPRPTDPVSTSSPPDIPATVEDQP